MTGPFVSRHARPLLHALIDAAEQPLPCAAEPEIWQSSNTADIAQAVATCNSCPLRTLCRDAGREGNEGGIWGAEPRRKRAAVLRRSR